METAEKVFMWVGVLTTVLAVVWVIMFFYTCGGVHSMCFP